MTRVAARYVAQPAPTYREHDEELYAVAIERATRRESECDAILGLLGENPQMSWYAVEVSRELGISYTRATWRLKVLEREGLLSSEHRPSPMSGNGRRYYRLAGGK